MVDESLIFEEVLKPLIKQKKNDPREFPDETELEDVFYANGFESLTRQELKARVKKYKTKDPVFPPPKRVFLKRFRFLSHTLEVLQAQREEQAMSSHAYGTQTAEKKEVKKLQAKKPQEEIKKVQNRKRRIRGDRVKKQGKVQKESKKQKQEKAQEEEKIKAIPVVKAKVEAKINDGKAEDKPEESKAITPAATHKSVCAEDRARIECNPKEKAQEEKEHEEDSNEAQENKVESDAKQDSRKTELDKEPAVQESTLRLTEEEIKEESNKEKQEPNENEHNDAENCVKGIIDEIIRKVTEKDKLIDNKELHQVSLLSSEPNFSQDSFVILKVFNQSSTFLSKEDENEYLESDLSGYSDDEVILIEEAKPRIEPSTLRQIRKFLRNKNILPKARSALGKELRPPKKTEL